MSFLGNSPKSEKPCGAYMGNMCSGFGGKCICYSCGWDRADHVSNTLDFLRPIAENIVLGEE